MATHLTDTYDYLILLLLSDRCGVKTTERVSSCYVLLNVTSIPLWILSDLSSLRCLLLPELLPVRVRTIHRLRYIFLASHSLRIAYRCLQRTYVLPTSCRPVGCEQHRPLALG